MQQIDKEDFIDMETCKGLTENGMKIKSDYCWLYNDISKEWDIAHKSHLKEYADPSKLKYYFALKK